MDVSFVLPVWNERESLPPLLAEIRSAMGRRPDVSSYEVIVVDDGSDDGTCDALAAEPPPVRVIVQPHLGKTAALHAGFRAARCPVLVTLDGDGQDDPAEVGALLDRLASGDEFAMGLRQDRKDGRRKRLSSRIASALRRAVLGDPFDDIGCGLRAFRADAVRDFPAWEGAHRYFPYFAWRAKRRCAVIPVRHRARASGRSKYGLLDRFIVGTVTLVRLRPALLAWIAALAFLAVGVLWNADWGETRDGILTLLRSKINHNILHRFLRGGGARGVSHLMHHPALPATVAVFISDLIGKRFPNVPVFARLNLPFFLWGCCGFLFLYRFVRENFDEATAALAVLLLACQPRFIAAAHIYHKDVPLLVGAILCLWLSAAAVRARGFRSSLVAGLAAGLAVSSHLAGVLMMAIHVAMQAAGRALTWRTAAAYFAAATLLVFALNPVLWLDPLSFVHASVYWTRSFWPYSESYLGARLTPLALPWHYIWVHFAAALPLFQLAFLVAGLWFLRRDARPATVGTALLLFIPMAVESSPLVTRYDGLRHVFLVLPAVAVIAAVGLVSVFRASNRTGRRALVALTAVFGVGLPVWRAARLHPYEEGYVNELTVALTRGRPGDALYLFDYDAALREMVAWTNAHADAGGTLSFSGFTSPGIFPLRSDLRRVDLGGDYRLFQGIVSGECRELYRVERYRFVLGTVGDCRPLRRVL